MPLSLDSDILMVIVSMAPPACDFPEHYEKRVSVKAEIKPHPLLAPAPALSDEPPPAPPPAPEADYTPVLPPDDPPPLPDEKFAIPPTVVRQPSFFFGEPGIGVMPSSPLEPPPVKRQKAERLTPPITRTVECDSCPMAPAEPKAVMDDTEYQMGALLSIFLLGIVSGASIVYAFSKPVVVHAAAAI